MLVGKKTLLKLIVRKTQPPNRELDVQKLKIQSVKLQNQFASLKDCDEDPTILWKSGIPLKRWLLELSIMFLQN